MLMLLAMLLALVPARMAWAQDATLTLQMDYTAKGKTVHLDGVTATVYRVAALDEGINQYTLVEPFTALNVDFNQGVDAKQMEALAKAALKIVASKKLAGTSVTSDANGVAAFGTLDYGVYLVAQTAKTGTAATYEDFAPFLISVPQLSENEIVYEVTALPKLTPKPANPTKPVEAKSTTSGPLVKTGDDTNPLLWMICFAAGSVLVLMGVLGKRRLNREEH